MIVDPPWCGGQTFVISYLNTLPVDLVTFSAEVIAALAVLTLKLVGMWRGAYRDITVASYASATVEYNDICFVYIEKFNSISGFSSVSVLNNYWVRVICTLITLVLIKDGATPFVNVYYILGVVMAKLLLLVYMSCSFRIVGGYGFLYSPP